MINWSVIDDYRPTTALSAAERLTLVQQAYNQINWPQNCQFIHIVGTNGKGSTATYLHQILQKTGQKIGLFSSPHIFSYPERIKINQKEIPPERLYKKFIQKTRNPTYNNLGVFAIMWLIAAEYFAEQLVDIAIIEAGIGGKFDSTNTINAPSTILTSVDLDHTNLLGATKTEILKQKIAVVPGQGTLFYPDNLPADLKSEITKYTKNNASSCQSVQAFQSLEKHFGWTKVEIEPGQVAELKLPGEHQLQNAALSVRVAQTIAPNLTNAQILAALNQTVFPLRCQLVVSGDSQIMLDGAHNQAGYRSLVDHLDAFTNQYEYHFIVGSRKKDSLTELVKQITPLAESITFTSDFSQAVNTSNSNESLEKTIKRLKKTIIQSKKTTKQPIIVVAGSLFLAADVLKLVNKGF